MNPLDLTNIPNGKLWHSFGIEILKVAPNEYQIRDNSNVIAVILFTKKETVLYSNTTVSIPNESDLHMEKVWNGIDNVLLKYFFGEEILKNIA